MIAMTGPEQVEEVIGELGRRYRTSISGLADALDRAVRGEEPSGDPHRFTYPTLKLHVPAVDRFAGPESFGVIDEPGVYEGSFVGSGLFDGYLREQLNILASRYRIDAEVTSGSTPIPVQYLPGERQPDLAILERFPRVDIMKIDDSIADSGVSATHRNRPLFLFEPLRVELALRRLQHYTGSEPEDFQDFVIFTNYRFHLECFLEYAAALSENGGNDTSGLAHYESITGPGGWSARLDKGPVALSEFLREFRDSSGRQQMPAWHMKSDRAGITIIDIGVGPSNAKTITDCLAVLRPHCWLMIGHCAGLDHRMRIGDLILPNSYLRRDHVLDRYVATDTPIPAIAEVQAALEFGIESPARTGTVMTTADRNWEWQPAGDIDKLFAAVAVLGVDMESATIAANGYRYRVPYGSLLSISDMPLHNQPKLPSSAREFYLKSKFDHLRAAIVACQKMAENKNRMHSRKLRRIVNEVPFR
ncbi:AMP nucleosidase [Nocardia sp. NPDC020380]|uniref:AMP nucleosidase n=1 Tax=Nocardia sp. NPDC020380 TaxID=3364309 RepID=UPI00378D76A0